MENIGYSGQYHNNRECSIKVRTGEDIVNATGDAICGEFMIATGGAYPGLYIAAKTSSDDSDPKVYRVSEISTANRLGGGLFTNRWSALFDGLDDFFTLSSTATLSASTGYTLSAWINSTEQSRQQHILKAGSTDYISILNDEIWINGTSTFKIIPNSTINADDLQGWHHHVVTYDGSVAKYYLDGVYEGSVSGTIGDIAVATLSMGDTYQFEGYMSDIALFDSALTDGGVSVGEAAGGEIASLINNGKPLDISTLGLSLKAWWRFGDDPSDSPSGDTSISSVTDSSGNGYTLSASGNSTPYYYKLPSNNVHRVV